MSILNELLSEMFEVVRVLIGIPTVGGVHPAAYDNRLEMMKYLGIVQAASHYGKDKFEEIKLPTFDKMFKFDVYVIGRVLTPIARENLAQRAVDEGYDYLLFIDDDMLTPQDLFFHLYKHKKDIVAALAFTRNYPHRPVIYRLDKGFEDGKPWYSNYAILDYPKDSLVKCDAVGFGAVLIDTKVFKGMKGKWFATTSGRGEDIFFCHQAGEQGFEIYMDTTVKLGHLGDPINIDEKYYEEMPESKIKELRDALPEKKGVEI